MASRHDSPSSEYRILHVNVLSAKDVLPRSKNSKYNDCLSESHITYFGIRKEKLEIDFKAIRQDSRY